MTASGTGIVKNRCVVAIDIGTTYSGYAFSLAFKNKPRRISTNTWNARDPPLLSYKTPTALLLNPDKSFNSFGFEAEEDYAEIADYHKEELDDYYYFTRFATILHKAELECTTTIKDEKQKDALALEVYSIAIKFLKDDVFNKIIETNNGIEESDVHYVITVPAIWSASSEPFMRQAGYKAGINPDQLSIVLEPEAASIHCLNQNMSNECDQDTQYMVIDLGGGSADITAYELKNDNSCKELWSGRCASWESKSIDDAISDFVGNIFTGKVLKLLRQRSMEDYIYILRQFEIKKRFIKSNQKDKVLIKLPTMFLEIVKECLEGTSKEELLKKSSNPEVTFSGNQLRIPAETFRKLFKSTIDSLMEDIQNEKKLRDVETIFMVGGFAECELVQQAVATKFPNKTIIIPENAVLAVLKGAVLLGHTDKDKNSSDAEFSGTECVPTNKGKKLNKTLPQLSIRDTDITGFRDHLAYLDCHSDFRLKKSDTLGEISFDVICDQRIYHQNGSNILIKHIDSFWSKQTSERISDKEGLEVSLINLAGTDTQNYITLTLIYHLLVNGACINTTNESGNTPLHIAILKHNYLLVYLLLQHGDVAITHKNNAFKDCLALSLQENTEQITKAIAWHCARMFFKLQQLKFTYLNVWPGYAASEKEQTKKSHGIYLVAQYAGSTTSDLPGEFNNIPVIFRSIYQVNREGEYVSYLEKESIENACRNQILPHVFREKAADLFRKHSNLNIISYSGYKSRGYGTGKQNIQQEICISLYCRVKGIIPIGEKQFDAFIESYPTDVREGYCVFGTGVSPMDYQNTLKHGCCIGPNDDSKCGTLGGFVEFQGQDYFLTCAHVLYELHELTSKQLGRIVHVVQPPFQNGQPPAAFRSVGETSSALFLTDDHQKVSIDAAIVKVKGRNPTDGSFPAVSDRILSMAGYSKINPPTFNDGKVIGSISQDNIRSDVIKFGSQSGLTCGSFNLEETHVRMENKELKCILPYTFGSTGIPVSQSFTMFGQYEVFSNKGYEFFEEGDSGAFAFVLKDNKNDDLHCVGMCIGKTTYKSCIVTPMTEILNSFGLPLVLKSFRSQTGISFNTPLIQSNQQGQSQTATNITIENLLIQMQSTLNVVHQEVGDIKQDMGNVKQDMGNVKQDVGNMKQDVGNMKQDIASLQREQRKSLSHRRSSSL